MKRRIATFLACLLFGVGLATAQSQVSGTIIGSEDGEPVIGAAVKDASGKTVAITDDSGRFTAKVPVGTTLTVSYVGMKEQTFRAGANSRITMTTDAKALDETIVVAFGTEKKAAFTGSAKVIGSAELQQAQVGTITDALAGQVPGLQLSSDNGAPGATSTIRIRGISSINAGNSPLIVVDGAPYGGDLNNLNPNDVETVTVLKDAASTALYGARGANGVVIITTKTAKRGSEAKITLDAKFGWNSRALQHYETIDDPAQYYEMQYEALKNYYVMSKGYSASAAWKAANTALTGSNANGGLDYNIWSGIPDGQMLIGINGKINPNATLGRTVTYKGQEYYLYPDDWEDESTRTGTRQEYNISINGSHNKGTFLATLGYLKNEGISYNSDMERFTGRLRTDYQAKNWLKVGTSMNFSHYTYNQLDPRYNGSETQTANLWAFTSQMAPIYPLYLRNADGSKMVDENGITMLDYGDGMNAGISRAFISDANPLQDILLNTYQTEGNAASAYGFADITFMEGLKLTLNGTYNLDESRTTVVYNPYYGQYDTTGGTVYKEHDRYYSTDLQQLLNYTHSFNDVHNVSVMLGHEYYKTTSYYLYGSKSQMFSQSNKELNGAVVDGQSAGSYKSTYNNEGYFGRFLYDYDTRYFFSGYLRRDASSRFDPDYRWGTFWALGGAWLINKEKWFDAAWVNELKLKVSIGSQGNDNLPSNFLYTDRYSISNSDDEVGVTFSGKGTRNLTWETNTNFNAGVEFSLFGNRLTGSLEYYRRNTTDMLFEFKVPISLGYSTEWRNVGDMYNAGIEFDANYAIIRKKNIGWDFRLNLSTVRNRVTKLHDDLKSSTYYDMDGKAYKGYYNSYMGFITEGMPVTAIRSKVYAGVNENGESMWYKDVEQEVTDANGNIVYESDGKTPKTVRVHETTTTLSDADYYITKKSNMPSIYGGFGTTIRAYGFDFSANFSYQLGGWAFDDTYQTFMGSPSSGYTGWNIHKDMLKAWTTENTSSNIPRFQYSDLYTNASSTRFLTRTSYLNCENINLGYTLPTSLTQRIDIEKLRIYLACENVFYVSARKGFDPRQSWNSYSGKHSNSMNGTTYSPMRTISIGATVTF